MPGTDCARLNHSGKNWQNPLLGRVCLLTMGVLPRNCPSILAVRLRHPRLCSPGHHPTCWPDGSHAAQPAPDPVVRTPPCPAPQMPYRASTSCRPAGRGDALWPSSPVASLTGRSAVGRTPPPRSDCDVDPTPPAAGPWQPGGRTPVSADRGPCPLTPVAVDTTPARTRSA